MNATQSADRLLIEAERLLSIRRCKESLAYFDVVEATGMEADRCSAGRWMAHMLLGDYGAAWRESEATRERGAPDPNRFWEGEPLEGKRVMLRCLHGYGDTVQYLRWLPMLQSLAREVTVQAAPEMLPLLACLTDADRVTTWNAPGESDRNLWDVQVECAELPCLFRTTPATLPPPARLAFPEADLHQIRLRLGPRVKPRVGLAWKGSDFDRARSIPFELLASTLLQRHDVEFWSLQPPAMNVEWNEFCAGRGWKERTFYATAADTVPKHAGIADMAAFASQMDLVITIDTLAAHVAGSVDATTWLLLKREADWRWMLHRQDTPWYPGMRLFRQGVDGDWQTVLTRVCEQMRDWNEEKHV